MTRAELREKYGAVCVSVGDGPTWNLALEFEGVVATRPMPVPIKEVWTSDRHDFVDGVCRWCGESFGG